MPMPVGGAFALGRSMARGGGYYGGYEEELDPIEKEYQEQKEFIQENLKCTVKLFKTAVPPEGGKVDGILILEAKKEVEHAGLFLLMKGLPLQGKRKQKAGKSAVKFMVVGGMEEDEVGVVEGGTRESYPLELNVPEELPMPLITGEGKLVYRLQVWVNTPGETRGRCVWLGDTMLRWMGRRVVTGEERGKGLQLEQKVESRRSLMGLGRRKVAEVEWRVKRAGFVVGERMEVELWGDTREKGGMELEWNVEFVQKVWYQVPQGNIQPKLVVRMKINVLGKEEDGGEIEEGGEESGKSMVWRGRIQVPRRITPSCKWDYANSVSYVLRFKVGVKGEAKEDWVVGELPVIVGTSKEVVEGEEEEEEDQEEDGGGSSRVSPVPLEGAVGKGQGQEKGRRGSDGDEGGAAGARRSRSMSFLPSWARPAGRRRESISSMDSIQSFASSTLSMFRLPPSYSQLSSRRPTLETLPPNYYELELQEHGLLAPENDQDTEPVASTSSSPGIPHITGEQDEDKEN